MCLIDLEADAGLEPATLGSLVETLNLFSNRPIAGRQVLLVDVGVQQNLRVRDGGEAIALQARGLEDIGPTLIILVRAGLPDFGVRPDRDVRDQVLQVLIGQDVLEPKQFRCRQAAVLVPDTIRCRGG